MAYALIVERLDHRALVDRQVAGLAMVLGATGELPDPGAARLQFDEFLASPLHAGQTLSAEQRALRKVLLGHE